MKIAAPVSPADSNSRADPSRRRRTAGHAGVDLSEGLRRSYEMGFDPIRIEDRRVGWTRRAVRRVGRLLSLRGEGVGRDVAGAVLRGDLTRARQMASTATRSSALALVTPKFVSPTYRCVWISTPKVASRSILAALTSADPECKIYQMNAVDLCRVRPDVRDWFTFAFVRHPFERALSFWYELHVSPWRYTEGRRRLLFQKRADLFDRFYGLADTQEFDAYCEWLNTPYGADQHADEHFVSMESVLRLDNGRLPDFVGRLESIEADWRSVVARLGMPVPELPFVHSGVGWNAVAEDVQAMRSARTRLLTARNRELLSVRYASDLEIWRRC